MSDAQTGQAVRIEELTEAQRRVVLALIEASRQVGRPTSNDPEPDVQPASPDGLAVAGHTLAWKEDPWRQHLEPL